jgi:hypothetical protein
MRGLPARACVALWVLFLASWATKSPAASPPDTTERHDGIPINESTPVDHDARPVRPPAEREPSLPAHLYREAIVEELSRIFDIPDKIIWALGPLGVEPNRDAANVNAMDEVPNSTWFTNRNHIRSVSPEAIRKGPKNGLRPETPWTITDMKRGGITPGFQIKDKNGERWVIKLDAPGYPQAGSGAAVVSSRLIWAAGYYFSHDEAVTFKRSDLTLDEELVLGKDGAKPVSESYLDHLLALGARDPDGTQYAAASLFLEGSPLGPFEFRGRREDDPNDWYQHKNRRELRGLWVFYSWINNWDVKDHQSLDMFHAPDGDSAGHVIHNLLDASGSLGAAGKGAKDLPAGYEKRIDFGWIMKRIVTLGFVEEPWRKVNQETGIPSVGNFASERFEPDDWKPLQDLAPFREKEMGDLYWGAKLVASFSDAQIRAAIDAAGYGDPRAPEFLFRALRERRDAIAREWFARVAPLDFFIVQNGNLMFRDLAVDIGIASAREYEARVTPEGSGTAKVLRLRETGLPLSALGDAPGVTIELRVAGLDARPVRLELRRGSPWSLVRVRHE